MWIVSKSNWKIYRKIMGYRQYYRFTLWGPRSDGYKYKEMLMHALGRRPCVRKGKMGSYCPCYWAGYFRVNW